MSAIKKIMFFVFLILIVVGGILGYVGFKDFNDNQKQESYNQGVVDAGIFIMQGVAKCQPFPIGYENVTLNLFALECLSQEQIDAIKEAG